MSKEFSQPAGEEVIEQIAPETPYEAKIAPLKGDPNAIFKLGRTENDVKIAKLMRRSARGQAVRNALKFVSRPTGILTVASPAVLGTAGLVTLFGATLPVSLPTLATAAAIGAVAYGATKLTQWSIDFAGWRARKKAGELATKTAEIKGKVPELTPIFRRKTKNMVDGVVDYDPSYLSAMVMRMRGNNAEGVALALDSALALTAGHLIGGVVASADTIAAATHGAHTAHAAVRTVDTLHNVHKAHTAVKGVAAVAKGGALIGGGKAALVAVGHAAPPVLIGTGLYYGVKFGLDRIEESKVRGSMRSEAEKFAPHVLEYHRSRRTA